MDGVARETGEGKLPDPCTEGVFPDNVWVPVGTMVCTGDHINSSRT